MNDQLLVLIEQWRAKAAVKDAFHATMGMGWKACANDLEAALAASGWQPIATAPKDGTKVLLFLPVQGHRVEPTILVGRVTGGPTDATHWLPLPPPPKEGHNG